MNEFIELVREMPIETAIERIEQYGYITPDDFI